METIEPIALGLISGLIGAFLFTLLPIRKPRRKIGLGQHIHQYDHMEGDGKGWRCGICDQPRGY